MSCSHGSRRLAAPRRRSDAARMWSPNRAGHRSASIAHASASAGRSRRSISQSGAVMVSIRYGNTRCVERVLAVARKFQRPRRTNVPGQARPASLASARVRGHLPFLLSRTGTPPGAIDPRRWCLSGPCLLSRTVSVCPTPHLPAETRTGVGHDRDIRGTPTETFTETLAPTWDTTNVSVSRTPITTTTTRSWLGTGSPYRCRGGRSDWPPTTRRAAAVLSSSP